MDLTQEVTKEELQKQVTTSRIRADATDIHLRRTQAIAYALAQHINPDAPPHVQQLAEGVVERTERDKKDVEHLTRIVDAMREAGWW